MSLWYDMQAWSVNWLLCSLLCSCCSVRCCPNLNGAMVMEKDDDVKNNTVCFTFNFLTVQDGKAVFEEAHSPK